MTRRTALYARAVLAVVVGFLSLGSARLAMAQTPPPEVETTPVPVPIIRRAPHMVGHKGKAVIKGRVRNGLEGDEITLERRLFSQEWETARSGELNAQLKVRFSHANPVHTAKYRLRHGPSSETSATVKIRVRSRLRVRVNSRHLLAGRRLKVTGSLRAAAPDRRVLVERRSGGLWRTVGRRPAANGTFGASLRLGNAGRTVVRVTFKGDHLNTAARGTRHVTAYDPDLASWYGPGLYGGETACGGNLGWDTLGVAHRTLPCGTKVSLLYEGRTTTVTVIDRGPYGAAEWDLTRATAARLNFSGHGTIGTTH